MRTHTEDYKTAIGTGGREIKSKISYTLNGTETTLNDNDLFSVKYTTNGNILKSVMKSVEIISKNNIPLETILNCEFGVKINGEYEYINLGNYVVFSSEKQEELNNYKILCYDKMLYSMVDYSELNITYPITIRNYLNAICQKLGITFASVNDTFANYNRQINEDLYINQGYTFRDVLDELAQVTGSTICINGNDALEVRYITDTHDTINEDYLKNINVTFGKMYGPVNSIVLSRSAETDNVYIQDAKSIAQNGLCEIKIVDNQIMNFNDRADYLPDLLSRLGGLQYYINDFSSPGITYYDLCDRYSVQIGEETYSCVMFNDEINVTQGLEENIYTEIPGESKTDYTKADKTDRRINQTYLIVDKQNQAIEGVVSRVDGQDEQIAQIRIQYNEILSKISDIADITTSGESSYASVNLLDVNASQPISVKIHPITEHIAYDYPHNDYPRIDYPKSRTLRFTNTTTNEVFDWILPTNLWYYDSTHYDELELSYGDGTNSSVIVTRRCQINADASISLLDTPTTETYSYPDWLVLTDGDYTISLIDNTSGYLYVQLMAKNIYTTQFYTKVETNSLIDQTANSITEGVNAKFSGYSTTTEMNTSISQKIANNNTAYVDIEVSKKVNNDDYTKAQIVAKINDNTSQAKINADNVDIEANDVLNILSGNTINLTSKNIAINSTNFSVDNNGNTTMNNATLNGGEIKSSNYVANTSGTKISLTDGSIDTKNFKVDNYGNVKITDTGQAGNTSLTIISNENQTYELKSLLRSDGIFLSQSSNFPDNNFIYITTAAVGRPSIQLHGKNDDNNMLIGHSFINVADNNNSTTITAASITTPEVIQTSLETSKKNFEKFEDALDIINKVDIYKYHLKGQDDKEKKHIGFVIGDKFNYSEEITSQNNDGVDLYSMISVCFQAIKEQQEMIENLENRIKELESDK